MKKIIVTGGCGFIGSNLVDYLINKKYFVINLDKLTYASNKYHNKFRSKKNYKLIRVDIANKKRIIEIIKKYNPKVIFNLAAETHVDRSIDGPSNFIHSNILGTFGLLESLRFLKKKNITPKLIHVSTDEVYGNIKKGTKSDEEHRYDPSSPYSASKASSNHLVNSYIKTYKLNIIITNCCNNYGPYQFPEKLIPKMILNIFNNKELPIYSKGKNTREWIHVNDHCDALFKLYLNGKKNESYNVGSGVSLRNIDLVKQIIKICKTMKIKISKKTRIKFVKDRPGHDFRYSLDNKKIFKQLKWKPKIKFENGLKNTIIWYLENKNFLKNISKKNYEKRFGLKI
ncbi:dTDP-glucose 4,6-dehydratase [Pelagibacterales bacterium SAG-MED41]|nr:dTDP-glucose 4,6-dehydratase [Pelagibacterales bacterium SAG-MED41]|tara:strand:+ start:2308 stop:3333 length:1026 start_codon:yes stop_codon:yes gene_type:complete